MFQIHQYFAVRRPSWFKIRPLASATSAFTPLTTAKPPFTADGEEWRSLKEAGGSLDQRCLPFDKANGRASRMGLGCPCLLPCAFLVHFFCNPLPKRYRVGSFWTYRYIFFFYRQSLTQQAVLSNDHRHQKALSNSKPFHGRRDYYELFSIRPCHFSPT